MVELRREVQSLQMTLDVIKENGINVHSRLTLMNTRISHLEHYLGLRKHSFASSDELWKFFQARDDIQKGRRPVSAFHEAHNAVQRDRKQAHKHGTSKRVA